MHASSLENMQKCFEKYVKNWSWTGGEKISVIDIGGVNINGSYADIFSGEEFEYKTADIVAGDNVDIVLKDQYKLPFEDNSIDLIISGQVLEHVEFFWILFAEIIRALRNDGLGIIIAPSAGPVHKYPVDCYRFYPDSYNALAKLTNCNVVSMWLDQRGPWKDLVGVFSKGPIHVKNGIVNYPKRAHWQQNRFERETAPAPLITEELDAKHELTQGDTHYIKVLSRLHKELKPNMYLELGVRHGNSLQLAECEALGVDPEYDLKVELGKNHTLIKSTSDRFFEDKGDEFFRRKKIDLAFIDGMHLFEFVLRDFIHVETHSLPHTVVVIDDVLPNHPAQARRKRTTRVWTGDVWKIKDCLKEFRPDLNLTLLDTYPTGLLVITGLNSKSSMLIEKYNPIVRKYKSLTLNGKAEKRVVGREGALASMDNQYWRWLSDFVGKTETYNKD